MCCLVYTHEPEETASIDKLREMSFSSNHDEQLLVDEWSKSDLVALPWSALPFQLLMAA